MPTPDARLLRNVLLPACLLLPCALQAQTYSRTETTAFADDTTRWVLGQVASVTCTAAIPASADCDGDVVSQTLYHAGNALPASHWAYGKRQQSMTWNTDGTLATSQDGRNLTTTLSNWYRGIPRRIQFADGRARTAVVSAEGWLTSTTDELGYTTAFAYDPMGRLSRITYPSADTVAWAPLVRAFEPVASAEYGIAAGHWRQTVTVGNAVATTYYDGLWRPLLLREYDAADPGGTQRFTRYSWDAQSRQTFSSYPSATSTPGTGTWTEYDALGRVTSRSQDSELGLLTTLTQYLPGFQTRVTDPRNQSTTTTAHLAYDTPDTQWPLEITHPEGAYTSFARLSSGAVSTLTRSGNGKSVARQWAYDANMQLCRQVEPETGATLYGHDAAGNLAWSAAGLPASTPCEPNGTSAAVAARKVTRTYDARNWLKSLSFPDNNGNQNWTYTADGLTDSVTTFNGGVSLVNRYAWNKRRLLASETQANDTYTWTVGYGYDSLGHRSRIDYPAGLSVTYALNALGQPTQVGSTAGAIYASGIRYHPNGAMSGFTYGNGIVHGMQQNPRQLPQRSTDAGVLDYDIAYDANANTIQVHDHARGAAYSRWMTYDGLDRLATATSASFGGGQVHRFTYDAVDNLRSWTLAGVKDYANYYYGPDNRLTSIQDSSGASIVGLGYDVQGNLGNKNGSLHTFDFGNRLRSSSGPGGSTNETYRYDAHGRRVLATTLGSGKNYALYSAEGQLLWERDERASARLEYIHLNGSLLASRRRPIGADTAAVYYYHADGLGSVVALTDSAKTVAIRYDYDPYGALTNRPAHNRPGYTGHVMDLATGLTYMQQRYYDPGIGRFLNVDPVSADSSTGENFNRYWYANNNPYKFTDPDGRASYVFWYSPTKAVVVIPYAVSDPHGVAKFTNAQVNAQIKNAYSGRVELNGRKIDVKAVGLPVTLNAQTNALPNVNVIDVNPSTTLSSTNDIGGNRVDLRGSADSGVVTHELGHTAGAGDQHSKGVDVNRNRLPDSYQDTNSMMGTASGKANAQTLREILTAPSARQQCKPTGQSGQCQ